MGRVYTFTCPRCEYQARVGGAVAEGFHCVTQTILCRDCKALYDVTLRVRVPETGAVATSRHKRRRLPAKTDHLPPMLLFGQPPRTQWLQFKPACPASELHQIEVWNDPGKCPRCNTFLERDVMPYRIWD